jgi:ATP-binding cassette subfamily B (MDR/TAP) protein 6
MNINKMTYCPPNITFIEIWIDHGLSKCFMDTISSSIITLYLLIFGSIQLWMYRRYGTQIDFGTLHRSKLYVIQKLFLYFIPLLSLIRITLQAIVLDEKQVYGYMVRIIIKTLI